MSKAIIEINRKLRLARDRIRSERTVMPRIVLPTVQHTSGVTGIVRAVTQEAAGTDATLSVKLTDAQGAAMGDAFDVTYEFTDNATALNQCVPQIKSGTTVFVSKIDGDWFLISPSPGLFDICS